MNLRTKITLTFEAPESETKWQQWVHDSQESCRGGNQLKGEGSVGEEESISWSYPQLEALYSQPSYQVTSSTVT